MAMQIDMFSQIIEIKFIELYLLLFESHKVIDTHKKKFNKEKKIISQKDLMSSILEFLLKSFI